MQRKVCARERAPFYLQQQRGKEKGKDRKKGRWKIREVALDGVDGDVMEPNRTRVKQHGAWRLSVENDLSLDDQPLTIIRACR